MVNQCSSLNKGVTWWKWVAPVKRQAVASGPFVIPVMSSKAAPHTLHHHHHTNSNIRTDPIPEISSTPSSSSLTTTLSLWAKYAKKDSLLRALLKWLGYLVWHSCNQCIFLRLLYVLLHGLYHNHEDQLRPKGSHLLVLKWLNHSTASWFLAYSEWAIKCNASAFFFLAIFVME